MLQFQLLHSNYIYLQQKMGVIIKMRQNSSRCQLENQKEVFVTVASEIKKGKSVSEIFKQFFKFN